MIPKSIINTITEALDETWFIRLKNLNVQQVSLSLDTINDDKLLDYFAEQMGLPTGIFNLKNLSYEQRKGLIGGYFSLIKKNNGTFKSIETMALLLGATSAQASLRNRSIRYDGAMVYNGSTFYDGGDRFNQFAIEITVDIASSNRVEFESRLQLLFTFVQPARLYLSQIIYL